LLQYIAVNYYAHRVVEKYWQERERSCELGHEKRAELNPKTAPFVFILAIALFLTLILE